MRPLHLTIHERSRARFGEYAPRPAGPAQLAAAERLLGALPPGYRSFLVELGEAPWPLPIGNVADFADRRWFDKPAWFVPFAHDPAGHYWGFAVRGRRDRRPAIAFWNHAEQAIDDPPGEAGSFETWLKDQVLTGLRRDHAERRDRLFAGLTPRPGAFTPKLAEARAAGRALDVELPEDYLAFTTSIGSLTAPVQIVDALDLAGLTEALRRAHPDAPPRLAAFARTGAREFVAFGERGDLRYFGGAAGPPDFLEWCEALRARAAQPAAPADRPAVVRRARSVPDATDRLRGLLEQMRADALIETAPTFCPALVAAELAGTRLTGAAIVAALLERDDVIDVFVTDADVDALLDEPPV